MRLQLAARIDAFRLSDRIPGMKSAQRRSEERLPTPVRVTGPDNGARMGGARRLSARVRSINQARRNAEESLSLVKTAQDGLTTTTDLLTQARDLAAKAADGGLTDAQRNDLQKDFQAVLGELGTLSQRHRYGSQSLLDGSFRDRDLATGANGGADALSVSIADMRMTAIGEVTTTTTTTPGSADVTASQAVDGLAILAGDVTLNGVGIADSLASDDLLSTRHAEASAIAKAAAINKSTAEHGVTASVGAATFTAGGAVTAGDLKNSALHINGVNSGRVDGVQAGDAGGQLTAAINAKSGSTGVTASVDGGVLTLTAADGRNIELDVRRNGAISGYAKVTNQMAYGEISLSSPSDITVGGAAPLSRLGIAAGTTESTATTTTTTTFKSVAQASVSSEAAASEAVGILDAALARVAKEQDDLGFVGGRIEQSIGRLRRQADGLNAGKRRIDDADLALATAQRAADRSRRSGATALAAHGVLDPSRVLDLIEMNTSAFGLGG